MQKLRTLNPSSPSDAAAEAPANPVPTTNDIEMSFIGRIHPIFGGLCNLSIFRQETLRVFLNLFESYLKIFVCKFKVKLNGNSPFNKRSKCKLG